MKALTLWQPWATLVAIGAKRIETRSWQTAHRGPLAIHAAKELPPEAEVEVFNEPFYSTLARAVGLPPAEDRGNWQEVAARLPLGGILAVVDLTHIGRMYHDGPRHDPEWRVKPKEWTVQPDEVAFGNYQVGRYGWVLADVRRLPEPIPCRGRQTLWETPPDVDRQLRAFLLAECDVELADLRRRLAATRARAMKDPAALAEWEEAERRVAEVEGLQRFLHRIPDAQEVR